MLNHNQTRDIGLINLFPTTGAPANDASPDLPPASEEVARSFGASAGLNARQRRCHASGGGRRINLTSNSPGLLFVRVIFKHAAT